MALRLCACAVLALAVYARTPQPRPIVFVDVAVIAMTAGESILEHRTVLVSGDRITAVEPAGQIKIPENAERIDGRGSFLIPGLADMHVHLEYFDDPAILGLFIANGVTTVRNMDGRPYLLDWKRKIAAGELAGPRIYTAGPLLDGDPTIRPDNTVVRTAAEARAIVGEQAAAGYDFIKVYSGLSAEAYEAIAAAARERGLPLAGHVPRAAGIEAILAARQASLEHLGDYASLVESDTSPLKGARHWSKRYLGMPIDLEKARALGARQAGAGTWTVPTLIQPERELLRPDAIDARLASEEVAHIPAEGRKQWEEQARGVAARMDDEDWKRVEAGRKHRRELTGALHGAGVRMLAGTDTPNPFVVPGFALHDELVLLVKAGFTPWEALAAATRDAAAFLGAGAEWGTIERGKAADLVLLERNPLDRIDATRAIAGVMVRGRWLPAERRAEILSALRNK